MEHNSPSPQNQQKKKWLALGALLSLVILGGIVYQASLRHDSKSEVESTGEPAEGTHVDPQSPSATAALNADGSSVARSDTHSAVDPGGSASDGTSVIDSNVGSDSARVAGTHTTGPLPDGSVAAPAASAPGLFAGLRQKFSGMFSIGGKEAGKTPGLGLPGLTDTGSLAPRDPAQIEAVKIDISRNCYVETFVHKTVKAHSSG